MYILIFFLVVLTTRATEGLSALSQSGRVQERSLPRRLGLFDENENDHKLPDYCGVWAEPRLVAPPVTRKYTAKKFASLSQVQVIFRAGRRTPYAPHGDVCWKDFISNIINYNVAASALSEGYRAITADGVEPLDEHIIRENIPRSDQIDPYQARLTFKGRNQIQELGKALKRSYLVGCTVACLEVDRRIPLNEQVYIRTTNTSRTILSAGELYVTIAKEAKLKSNKTILIDTMPYKEDHWTENLDSDEDLQNEWLRFLGEEDIFVKLLEKHNDILANMTEESKVDFTAVREANAPSLALLDCWYAGLCSNEQYPDGGPEFIPEQLESQVHSLFDDLFAAPRAGPGTNFSRIAMRHAIRDVRDQLQQRLHGGGYPLVFWGAHETTIASFLTALEETTPNSGEPVERASHLWDRKTVPYASAIILELFRFVERTEDFQGEGAFRLLYNGKDLTTSFPGCSSDSPCPIETFLGQTRWVDPEDFSDSSSSGSRSHLGCGLVAVIMLFSTSFLF